MGKTRQQVSAEATVDGFRRALGPFVVAADTARMAMVFTDAKVTPEPIIFANDSFLSLTGYSRREVVGRSLGTVLGTKHPASQAFPPGLAEFEVSCRREDGRPFWALCLVSPVLDADGKSEQHVVSLVDVTAHKLEEERLRFLLEELNHRTQNTLAIVEAIAVQTLSGLSSDEVFENFQGRLHALSAAQRLLDQGNRGWVLLRDVISQMLFAFGLSDRRAGRFSLVGDDVLLPPKTALSLAMLVHELAANAAKHGALSVSPPGLVDISWSIQIDHPTTRIELRWQESGGPHVFPRSRRGFGSQLIERGLARELKDVRVDYEPSGVVCSLVILIEPDLVADNAQ